MSHDAGIRDKLLVALDRSDLESAVSLARAAAPFVGGVKVGLELFTSAGPDAIDHFTESGQRVFLDGKFHDIPNTVAGACRAATRRGAWMMNIHATGGAAMLKAAVDAVRSESERIGVARPILLGVTILTSLDSQLLTEVFRVSTDSADLALHLAHLSQSCGLDGVVASALEVAAIRRECGSQFTILVPGTRRLASSLNDQKRSATPGEALAAGADFLVIGRDITAAPDPSAAAAELLAELSGG